MKRTVTVWSIVFLSLAMFLSSCQGDRTSVDGHDADTAAGIGSIFPPSDDSQTGVYQPWSGMGMERFLDGDKYIFRTENGYLRLNLKTGTLSGLHADPLCLHTGEECPLYGATVEFVDGDNVYFVREQSEARTFDPSVGRYTTESERAFCVYNISSGKTRTVAELGEQNIAFHAVYGGKLYYTRETEVEGESYVAMHLYACPSDAFGEEEVCIYRTDPLSRDGAQSLFTITDGQAYFSVGDHVLIRYDLHTKEEERLDFGEALIVAPRVGNRIFYRGLYGDPVAYRAVYDARGNPMQSEDGTPLTVPVYEMYYMRRDIITGEVVLLSDIPCGVGTIPAYPDSLTAKYIYLPYPDGIWRCDHDGNKLKRVQTQAQIDAHPEVNGWLKIYIGEIIFYISDAGEVRYFNMQSGEFSAYGVGESQSTETEDKGDYHDPNHQ